MPSAHGGQPQIGLALLQVRVGWEAARQVVLAQVHPLYVAGYAPLVAVAAQPVCRQSPWEGAGKTHFTLLQTVVVQAA